MDKEHETQLYNRYMFILNIDLLSFKMIVLMVEMIDINESDKSTRIYYMSRKQSYDKTILHLLAPQDQAMGTPAPSFVERGQFGAPPQEIRYELGSSRKPFDPALSH